MAPFIPLLIRKCISKSGKTLLYRADLKKLDETMPEDGKVLIQEAKGQVEEMRQILNSMRRDYYELVQKMKEVSDTITAIVEAQEKYGTVGDEKAKNVIALYGALLEMNEKAGALGSDSVRNAGYVLYAYLGGQAKRDVNYSPDPERG